MIEQLLTRIGDAVGGWLYLLAGALAFGEAAFLLGLVIPGETALLVAGVFCHRGVLQLWLMIVIAVVAAILGDAVGYEFGRHLGPALRTSRAGRRVGEHRWRTVDDFLARHGGKAVFLGRMTALLRALTPSMAGMSGMHYPTFLRWNALGGVIWASGCVLLGYAFSSALGLIGRSLTWAPIAILLVVAAAYLVLHRRRRSAERNPASAVTDATD